MSEPLYGYFSDTHYAQAGGMTYRGLGGEEIEVTAVFATSKEAEQYNFTDKRCVGLVTEMIRQDEKRKATATVAMWEKISKEYKPISLNFENYYDHVPDRFIRMIPKEIGAKDKLELNEAEKWAVDKGELTEATKALMERTNCSESPAKYLIASYRAARSHRLTKDEQSYLDKGLKINAVKLIRDRTGCSLKDAVDTANEYLERRK